MSLETGEQYQVTYVRLKEGTTHPPGIYLNAEQLAFILDDLGASAEATIVRYWEGIARATSDNVMTEHTFWEAFT